VVPADSSLIVALLECDSLGNVLLKELMTLQGQRVRQDIMLRNNTITVGAYADSVLVHLKYRLIYERKLQKAISDLKASVKVEKKKPPAFWLKFLAWSGAIAWVTLIVWAFVKGYLNWIPKLLKTIKTWL
jgi:hypothetical protein